MPLPSEVWKAYTHYYTHGGNNPEPRASSIRTHMLALFKSVYRGALHLTPFHLARRRLSHMYLDGVQPGRLLDVGCGSGERLALLQSLGWEVVGQEVDSSAAQHARDHYGVDVRIGTLEAIGLPEASFDAVVANHVIEHYFGQSWRGLEPPRHLYLFTPRTLMAAAEKAGITASLCETSAANAEILAVGSYDIRAGGHDRLGTASRLSQRIRAFAFQWRAWFVWLLQRGSGEECILRAKKTNSEASAHKSG